MADKRGHRSRKGAETDSSKYRASSIELFSREIVADKNTSKKIYSRDVDNLYPLRLERVINNSPTGRRCANLMAKYIAGNGNAFNFKIGKKKGKDYFINDLIRESANYLAKQGGVYFKLKYVLDLNASSGSKLIFKVGSSTLLNYVLMAKAQEDDEGYDGKFYIMEADDSGSLKTGEEEIDKWLYPFSLDPKVILAQMRADCKLKEIENPSIEDLIRNFRGQVFYLNTTPEYIYALPLGDMVYNDMDTEFRISNYHNTQTRKGFLGKTIITKYEADEDDAEDFEEELQTFLGSENSGSVFIVEVPEETTVELDKAFHVEQLKPQFDDKLFETTSKSIRQNILGAFNNIPEPLIFAGSTLFGTSADTYEQMKLFYWEQNEYERSLLEQTLRLFGYDVNILPLVQEKTKQTEQDV